MVAQVLELGERALLEPRGLGGRHVMESGSRQETQPPPKKPPTADMGEKTSPPTLSMKDRGSWSQLPCNPEEKRCQGPSGHSPTSLLLLSLPRQVGIMKQMSDCPDFSPDMNKFTF